MIGTLVAGGWGTTTGAAGTIDEAELVHDDEVDFMDEEVDGGEGEDQLFW